jgi:hypothetical protein
MQHIDLSPDHLKTLWVIGALERLATLGFLDKEIPWKVSQSAIDHWQRADENRFSLFQNEGDIRNYAAIVISLSSDPPISREDTAIQAIAILVAEFWTDKQRYRMVTSGLETILQ